MGFDTTVEVLIPQVSDPQEGIVILQNDPDTTEYANDNEDYQAQKVDDTVEASQKKRIVRKRKKLIQS
jgi:hypothetical protein